jgi:hypothetical protein
MGGGVQWDGQWRHQQEPDEQQDDRYPLNSWQTIARPSGMFAHCLLDFQQECLENCGNARVVFEAYRGGGGRACWLTHLSQAHIVSSSWSCPSPPTW